MIRIVCAAVLLGFGLSFVTIDDSSARPSCHRSKNCANRVSSADCHNCRVKGNKSWRAKHGAVRVSVNTAEGS
jgi:hypothetical protein